MMPMEGQRGEDSVKSFFNSPATMRASRRLVLSDLSGTEGSEGASEGMKMTRGEVVGSS